MKNLFKLKTPKKFYQSKFLYVNRQGSMEGNSGLRLTIFGASGRLGNSVGGALGMMGSDIIYPVKDTFLFNESVAWLKVGGNLGQIVINKKTNLNDPNIMRKLIKPSNVVINMIGAKTTCRTEEHFKEANVHIPRRIAKVSRK